MFDLRPRESDLVCPPCRDSIGAGAKVSCPECGATYHEECALTFGRCVNLACVGHLASERMVQALHRIGAIARRLPAWRLEGLVRQSGAQGPWVVYFLPASAPVRSSEDAARVVGEVLDQSTYDGRFRLQSRHPELLVRVESRSEVARILRDLRAVGVDAYSLSLFDLIQPLETFQAVAFFKDDPLVVADETGLSRAYQRHCERLIVPFQRLETSQRVTLAPFSCLSNAWTVKRKLATERRRRLEEGFYVFRPDEPVPLEVREDGLQHLVGISTRPSSRQNLLRVRETFSLGQRVMTRSVGDAKVPRLQTALRLARDLHQQSNRTSVALLARLIYWAWMEARLKRARKPALACV